MQTVIQNAEFNDPRLVPLYDVWCLWGPPDEFFMALANETPKAKVLDFGCGTGRLAIALAAAGHTVTGLDLATDSLRLARSKPMAEQVCWLAGGHELLPQNAFDLAVMNSHVAQVFVDDHDWLQALTSLQRSLLPGGRLAFDSRNPAAQAWKAWNPVDSFRRITAPDGQAVELWIDVLKVAGDTITHQIHYRFENGEELLSQSTLRFRSENALRSSLTAAGFEVEQIYGGWQRNPVGHPDGEFIVQAHKS